jgi:predicted DNA-binding transcriptional regulator AlpA
MSIRPKISALWKRQNCSALIDHHAFSATVPVKPSARWVRTMTMHDELSHMTIADVCSELSISRSTFYDWRAARKAPRCIRLPNGSLRIRRADLAQWLENHVEVA